jgi:sugar phosphate isomerase/epimerase
MKLSLSVRIAEAPGTKDRALMGMQDLAQLASENGYAAVCMRASQAGIATPPEQVAAIRRLLDARGLAVSMVTGDIPIPANDADAPRALRNITPYLDLAEALGADLIRIGMKTAEDIAWAQRASDAARERGIRLAHQCHTASLFETVEGSLEVLRAVGRPNFGLIYEPANLELCGQPYGPAVIARFAPHLFNVYLQNQLLTPDGRAGLETWTRGPVRYDPIPLHDPRGIDFPAVFAGLARIGYDGTVTVHQAGGDHAAAGSGARERGVLADAGDL